MKYNLKGLDKLLTQLADMSDSLVFDEEARKALNKGSKIVEDITRKELESLPVDNRVRVPDRTSINQMQKNALLKGFGLAPIQYKDGRKNTMDRKTGVNRDVNKAGQPNVVVARRLENGTSYMPKNPVFSRASRKARNQCINAMADSLKESINNIWK